VTIRGSRPRRRLAVIKGDYVWWDELNKRWDLTPRAFYEQYDPKVRALIRVVLRSWFIPPEKPIQLPLFGGKP